MTDQLRHHLVEDAQLNPEVIDALVALGYHSVEHIATATPEDLAGIEGLDANGAAKMVEVGRKVVDQKEAGLYVSPLTKKDEGDGETETTQPEETSPDLAYLGPLAALGPVPTAADNATDEA